MNLDDQVTVINGVGDVVASKLAKLGIRTVGDLIDHYPRKYDDFTNVTRISQLHPGMVTVKVVIKHAKSRYARRGLNITEAVASDETGSVRLIWFNQPYRADSIDNKKEYFVRGEFQLRSQRLSITNPSVELVSDFPIHSARIVPTYRATKGLKSTQLRKIIANLLPNIAKLDETLPEWVVKEQNLVSHSRALEKLHFPDENDDIELAKSRLGFEEVFQISLASLLNKYENASHNSVSIEFDEVKAQNFVASLPFKLTNSQRKVVWQIYNDLQNTQPMNRLVEGDVGSGKTVVACMAALMVMNVGFQVAIMAPTEILARQHAETMTTLLSPMNMSDKVGLLLGSMTQQQKQNALSTLSDGRTGLIIGTSALIQESVSMNNLALVVIDEQHRFGVDQRKKIVSKAGTMPHVLSMTATPIPRSLALVIYGEMDISVMSDLPRGKQVVKTELVSPNSTDKMYDSLSKQIEEGRQVFIVCPMIDENNSESYDSVIATYETLRVGKLVKYKVGLLHGKLKSDQKEKVMNDFSKGKTQVLITTTVIEVGIDIPNATVIVVLSPERFGLAQIHQLRGRVGRGAHKGYCYLVLSDSNQPSRRLRALVENHSGFDLAELDLEIRGPGAIYGTAQHGVIDLRIANLSDVKMIEAAKNAAQQFIEKKEKLVKYPELQRNVSNLRKVTNLN